MTSRELFEKAIEVVLEHEGGEFTDDPRDKGGATKFGIAQRWNPDVDVKSLTRSQAIVIYWDRYWKGRRYEELPEQVAIKVFDLAVNLGHKTAVSCLQRVLTRIIHEPYLRCCFAGPSLPFRGLRPPQPRIPLHPWALGGSDRLSVAVFQQTRPPVRLFLSCSPEEVADYGMAAPQARARCRHWLFQG
jgi:hypothetical protein